MSACKPLVGDPLANRSPEKVVHAVLCIAVYIAFTQPEHKLIDVLLAVLFAPVVIGAVEAALDDGPYGFNSVGMRHAVHVFLGAVLDLLVSVTLAFDSGISTMLIGVDHGAFPDVFRDGLADGFLILARYNHGLDLAFSLLHAEHGLLADCAATRLLLGQLLALPVGHVFTLASEVGSVHFHFTMQGLKIVAAHQAKPVKHVPCRRVADLEGMLEFECRHAFTGSHELVRRINPLLLASYPVVFQWRIGEAVEEASAVSAPVAFAVVLLLGDLAGASALGADNRLAIPAQLLKVLDSVLIRGILLDDFNEAQGFGVFLGHFSCLLLCFNLCLKYTKSSQLCKLIFIIPKLFLCGEHNPPFGVCNRSDCRRQIWRVEFAGMRHSMRHGLWRANSPSGYSWTMAYDH